MMASILLLLLGCVTQVLGVCSSIEVRKEWRKFSLDEQAAWINAVKCMAKLPHNQSLHSSVGLFASEYANITTNTSYYDDYAYTHCDLNPVIHFTGLFLPFHRFFVWSYTQALKQKCGYTGVAPYWDWTLDSADVKGASIWSDDPSSGLGQVIGVPDNDYVLGTGGFSSDFTLAYPAVHGLRRNFTLQPWVGFADLTEFFTEPYKDANASFTPTIIDQLVANYTGDYKGFQTYLEGFEGPHGAVHLIVGGDLAGNCPNDANAYCLANEGSPTFSANEPMFWMHHAMVDRVWWLWQHRSPNNTNAFFGGSVQNLTYYDEFPNGGPPWLTTKSLLPTDGILPAGTTIGDVMSTEGDYLCYTYES